MSEYQVIDKTVTERAIAAFDSIKTAIKDKGVEVSDTEPVEKYADKIRNIPSTLIDLPIDRSKPIKTSWIGVDLDGTLAYYEKWKGLECIGEPIPEMKQRVLGWLSEGKDVRIFTARVCPGNNVEIAQFHIEQWCLKNLGVILPVTCIKDFYMIELWDDQCIQVAKNEGRPTSDTKR